ncbi:MAG TPA: sigma-70 family RNA polymerase sigma factor [Solirubrobacteraceae bacterium]|nr:sigma-70 family RNA polymerase sigma factor [Solirubrobacteraceae bacterium]
MPPEIQHRSAVEARFAEVFAHLGLLSAYARRRGARDPDAIAAEAMAIAWRRLADVPRDDPRPWLIATARNLVLADRRRHAAALQDLKGVEPAAPPQAAVLELDHELEVALATLSDTDREALLLVAWEDLTPSAAAASLGISPAAFRVRLHRARRRLLYELEARRAHTQFNPAWSGNDL